METIGGVINRGRCRGRQDRVDRRAGVRHDRAQIDHGRGSRS